MQSPGCPRIDLADGNRYLDECTSASFFNDRLSMPTVAITGAAGAIGSVTAETFEDAGWDLVLLDVGDENTSSLETTFPDAHVFDCDLTDEFPTHKTFETIDEVEPLDAVLGLAGSFSMQPAVEATDDDYRRMLDVNFRTLFNTARAALPVLTKQDESFFLGVSAPAAVEGQSGAALYGASKGAVAGYVKSLDRERADDGLRATVLYPMDVVDTPANREAMPDADPSTWIEPRELADSMLHLATRTPRGHVRELKVHASA